MSDAVNKLEASLDDVFVKKAPALPEGGKKFLVDILPWVSLITGVLGLFASLGLYQAARLTNGLVDYANEMSAFYGSSARVESHLTLWVWLSLAVLVVQSVISLAAFPKLRQHAKRGWDLMFYSALVSVVYSVVHAFTWQGGVFSLFFGLIFSAVGFYLLFQIKSLYLGKKAAAAAPKSTEEPKK